MSLERNTFVQGLFFRFGIFLLLSSLAISDGIIDWLTYISKISFTVSASAFGASVQSFPIFTLSYYAVRSMIQERANQNPILVDVNVLGRLTSVNAKKIDSPNVQVNKNVDSLT